jgi:hypothetical protein
MRLNFNYVSVRIRKLAGNGGCNMIGRISELLLLLLLLLLLQVFSPWAGQGRDQSSVGGLVWFWYAAFWANS